MLVWLLEETSFVFLVSGCWGRSVSVGKSKLCHKVEPEILCRTRLPVLLRDNCSGESETVVSVAVAQIVNLLASVKIRLPFLRKESFECFPLTGWSRFAIQTTVGEGCLLNHMAKQKALSPTEWNPAEKTPFGEIRTSSGFSTERDVPSLRLSNVEDESGKQNAKGSRRNKTSEQPMMFMEWINVNVRDKHLGKRRQDQSK